MGKHTNDIQLIATIGPGKYIEVGYEELKIKFGYLCAIKEVIYLVVDAT